MSDDKPDHDYTNERVVGHRLRANRESYEPRLVSKERGYSPLQSPLDKIRVVEGDVDWDDTREVCLTVEELREMALMFTDLTEDE